MNINPMSVYDALARFSTRDAIRAALLVFVASVLRLIEVPLALGALLTGRALIALDGMALPRPPAPPARPRWAAANTRSGITATIF